MMLEYLNTDNLLYKNLLNAAKEQIKDLDTLGSELSKAKSASKEAKNKIQLIQTNLRVSFSS